MKNIRSCVKIGDFLCWKSDPSKPTFCVVTNISTKGVTINLLSNDAQVCFNGDIVDMEVTTPEKAFKYVVAQMKMRGPDLLRYLLSLDRKIKAFTCRHVFPADKMLEIAAVSAKYFAKQAA